VRRKTPKDSIAKEFMEKRLPKFVQKNWWGNTYDPTVLAEVKKLLFETQPQVFAAPKPVPIPAPAAGMARPQPPPPPPR
jgi:hypothetical protein